MHNFSTNSNFFFKCSKPNCHSTFDSDYRLKLHLRIHDNNYEYCQYCPFKYLVASDYEHHLRRHFEIKDFKCDQCGKLFISNIYLNKHYAIHEGIIYNCLLCEGYTASSKNCMNNHLRRKHSGNVGKVFSWESVEKFVKITK